MRNKIVGLALGLMVGVMSFMPAMTVSAAGGDVCSSCGEYGIAPTIIGYRDTIEYTEYCIHGRQKGNDKIVTTWAVVQYYCADCDVYFTDNEEVSTTIYCNGSDSF